MPKEGVDATPMSVFFGITFFGTKMKPIAFGYLFPKINGVF